MIKDIDLEGRAIVDPDSGQKTLALELALSSITDFVYTFDRDGRFLYVNKALLDLWGLTLEQAVGKNFFDLQYPAQLATKLQDQIQQVIRTGKGLSDETPYTSPTGAGGYFEYIFRPVFDADGDVEIVAGSTRDITARKQLEQDRADLLRDFEYERNRLKSLVDKAPAFIAVLRGENHTYELVNSAYKKLVGDRDFVGKTVKEALPEVAEQGFIALLDKVLKSGEPFVGKERPVAFRKDGVEDLRYLDFVYQPIFEADGSVSGVFVHGVDVTGQVHDRKAVEFANANLESRVQERTAEIEAAVREMQGFTYSISHDLRAPLRAIVSTSGMLVDDFGEKLDDEGRMLLSRQKMAANRMALLIDDLLKLSRLSRQTLEKKSIDATQAVWRAAEELSISPEHLKVQENMAVDADPQLLHIVLHNLLSNAAKFVATGSEPRIDVSQTDAVIRVRDEGIGFEDRYMPKIFLPFERLVADHDYEGTGIGLANVKRIVERHNGKVWAESEPGRGSSFYFTLG